MATPARNSGVPLDLDAVRRASVDGRAVAARVQALRRGIPRSRDERIAWLLSAVACTDLTTLQGDDTAARVRRLCALARRPLSSRLLKQLGWRGHPVHAAAVCIYPAFLADAIRAVDGSEVLVATVAAGFPAGLTSLDARRFEIEESVAAGADEIDAVITRAHALTGDWRSLYAEIRRFRAAAGSARLKVILATGELRSLTLIRRASEVALAAGADFLKTSTGKETVNATLPAGVVMARAIRAYRRRTGRDVGLKPAGGIRRAQHALEWIALVRSELGPSWVVPARFRIGASGLITEIAGELARLATRSPGRRGRPSSS